MYVLEDQPTPDKIGEPWRREAAHQMRLRQGMARGEPPLADAAPAGDDDRALVYERALHVGKSVRAMIFMGVFCRNIPIS